MKLKNIIEIEGCITLRSGLHIGSGDMEMHIGSEKSVIKHPHTNRPYIPGSSIKGKVRSLLEMASGLMLLTNGGPVSFKHIAELGEDKHCVTLLSNCKKILKIFGTGADNDNNYDLGPSRASFSDCYLSDCWIDKALNNRWPLTEVKSENSIDRISSKANPRFQERVPEGAIFDFLITFKQLELDDVSLEKDDESLLFYLLKGLRMLEIDALGGSGSRGYGRIEITLADDKMNKILHDINPFKLPQTVDATPTIEATPGVQS